MKLYITTSYKHLLLLTLFFVSCGRPNRHLIGSWQYMGNNTADAPEQMIFDGANNTLWHYQSDSTFLRYDIAKDTLWVMKGLVSTPYHIDKLRKKNLSLSANIDGNFQRWIFNSIEKYPTDYILKVPIQPTSQGIEKHWRDLVPALHAPTVELRLKNLILLFQEGDYITTPTIRYLIGLPPKGTIKETPEIAVHRYIVSQFERITRKGDTFVALLRNGEVNADLPIFNYVEGKRVLRTTLSLKVKKNALASFHTDYHHIRVDIDGVKVGKGWLLLGMPPLRIEGDWAELLGFRFYIAR